MNLPPALSVMIIYNMHKGSSNLHKQCLRYGRHSVSLLADQLTASARFCMCQLLSLSIFSSVFVSWSPSVGLHNKHLPPTACCTQITDVMLLWRLVVGYFAHYKFVNDNQNRWIKNMRCVEWSILVGEASWYDSLDPRSFTSCRHRRLASCSPEGQTMWTTRACCHDTSKYASVVNFNVMHYINSRFTYWH